MYMRMQPVSIIFGNPDWRSDKTGRPAHYHPWYQLGPGKNYGCLCQHRI